MRAMLWRMLALLLCLLASPAAAQMLLFGVGVGAAGRGASGPFLTLTGPSSGNVYAASTAFTVTLSGASFSGAQTVTISDGAQGGTLTPSVGAPGTSSVTVTPAAAATGFTFTYANATAGTYTLTFTNAQSWNNQPPLTITVNNVYTASGPGSGTVNLPSTAFTVTLSSGTFNGSNSITINDGSRGGTFTPSVGSPGTNSVTVTPTAATTSFTFTYTPIVVATINLSFTNNSSFVDPSPLTYVSNAVSGCTQGSLKFNGSCTTVWMTNFVTSP